jgi:NAD(P)-dependent dehydrogenase (short-subunit alcohol dehydrogenase family)
MVTETMQRFGAIHILVNNAGSVPAMQFTDVDDVKWHQMMEGKLLRHIRVTREVVPHVQKAGWGRIISIVTPDRIFHVAGTESVKKRKVSGTFVGLGYTKKGAIAHAGERKI